MSTPVYLYHLPKHSGRSRLHGSHTFEAKCAAGDKSSATAWLVATETLKGPEEAAYDEFVHVMEGLLENTKVVIKLQEVTSLSEREASVATQFRNRPANNVVIPICEFKCRHDLLHWMQPIRMREPFCTGGDTLLSVFVMEHISYNLAEYFEKHSNNEQALRSCLKQLGFALAELHFVHGMSHGDIGSGNIMLDIDTPKTNIYTIAGHQYSVDTHGFEPILIDFQRSVKYRRACVDAGTAADEIVLAYEFIARWCGKRDSMAPVLVRLSEVETMEGLLDIIQQL